MIAVIASFVVAEENAAAFEAIATGLAATVRANEPGNLQYQLVRSTKHPAQYRMMEVYRDQAAVDAHMASDWFKAAGPKLAPLLVEPLRIEKFDTID